MASGGLLPFVGVVQAFEMFDGHDLCALVMQDLVSGLVIFPEFLHRVCAGSLAVG